jgi:hypothetical protein
MLTSAITTREMVQQKRLAFWLFVLVRVLNAISNVSRVAPWTIKLKRVVRLTNTNY